MVKVSGQEKTEPMDALELRKLGAGFSVGEDLYGVSLVQLTERLEILRAEMARRFHLRSRGPAAVFVPVFGAGMGR